MTVIFGNQLAVRDAHGISYQVERVKIYPCVTRLQVPWISNPLIPLGAFQRQNFNFFLKSHI